MRIALTLALVSALVAACDEGSSDPGAAITEDGCGIAACTVASDDAFDPDSVSTGLEAGKADAVDRVLERLAEVTADDVLDDLDVAELFDAAGGKVSRGESRAIRDALFATDADYEVTPEALDKGMGMARVANLPDDEAAEVLANVSYGGTEIPQEVRDVVAMARLSGAVAYDVNEVDDDGDRVWSPYPAVTLPAGNMTFAYTEITPAALQADMDDVDVEYNAIVGIETATTPWGKEYKRARYEPRVGGTGHVLAHYDEVYHPDIYARGSQGQKWASNLAILSDGTFHCLPAPRRDQSQRLILTNPALSRGKHLLFNGHMSVRDGVVEDIELSGRLSKLAARGKATFIDPIPLLEAWGFQVSDSLRLRYGNTSSGTPVQDGGVIVDEAEPMPDPVVVDPSTPADPSTP